MLYHFLIPAPSEDANISLGTFIHGIGSDQAGPQGQLMIDGYGDKIAMFQNSTIRVYKIGSDASFTIIYDSVVAGQAMLGTYIFALKFSPDGTKLFALTSSSVGSTSFRYKRIYTISGDTVTLTSAFSTSTGTTISTPVMINYMLSDTIVYGYHLTVSNQFNVATETYGLSLTNTATSPLGAQYQAKSIMLGNKLIGGVQTSSPLAYYFRVINRDPTTYALTDASVAPGTSTPQYVGQVRGMCKVDESHFVMQTDDKIIYYRFNDSDNSFTELTSGASFNNVTTIGGGTWDMCYMTVNGKNCVVYKCGAGVNSVIKYVVVNGDSCSNPIALDFLPYNNSTGPFLFFYYCEQYDYFAYISTDHGTGARIRFYKGSSLFQ